MNQKILCLTLLAICIVLSLNGQSNQEKIKDIGLNFSSLSNFGIRYKKSRDDLRFFRLTLVTINGFNFKSVPDSMGSNKNSFGLGFNIGYEKRKSINNKFSIYSGLDFLTSFNSQMTNVVYDKIKFEKRSISLGVGYVIGCTFRINEDISISTEIIPSIVFTNEKLTNTVGKEKTDLTNNGLTYGFSNSGASITLSYRFVK